MLRLCLMLGKSIDQIEAMPSAHLSEWLAFSRIEALPDAHFDAAQVCAVVYNRLGDGSSKALTAEDFYARPAAAAKGRPVRPDGARPTAAESAGILGRRFAENHAAALKRIAAM
jgi:hypothetical protein